jgi:hypothetical protein
MGQCTVYVWLPENGNTGHGALKIGPETGAGSYVSWWPASEQKKEVGLFSLLNYKHRAEPVLSLADDNDNEEKDPDSITNISFGKLSELEMERYYLSQYGGPAKNLIYRLVSHNCCTMVAHILRAGGVGIAKKPSWGTIWMPATLNKYVKSLKPDLERVQKIHALTSSRSLGRKVF